LFLSILADVRRFTFWTLHLSYPLIHIYIMQRQVNFIQFVYTPILPVLIKFQPASIESIAKKKFQMLVG
jgi:hypothetical protein